MALLAAPWSDGELNEYRIKLPGGMTIGTFVYTAEANPSRVHNILLTTRAYVGGVPHQWSRVEAERETMRPISNTYMSAVLGDTRLDYEDRQARVQAKGKPATTVPLDGLYWDNEEVLWVMRRMPLSVGMKTKVAIMSPAGLPIKLDFSVTALEEVQVPAGKFRAYKVELGLVRQTIWVSADMPRPVVKLEAPGANIELASMRRVDTAPVTYRDNLTGLSVTAAPGWIFAPNEEAGPGETSFRMLDPEGKAFAGGWAKPLKTDPPQIAQQLRESLEEKTKSRSSELKAYQLRPSSVQTKAIGGQQAMSCVADYLDGDKKMVEYVALVATPNAKAVLFTRIAAEQFDSYRPRFDAIVETLKIQ
jgi:hypothetical protein